MAKDNEKTARMNKREDKWEDKDGNPRTKEERAEWEAKNKDNNGAVEPE